MITTDPSQQTDVLNTESELDEIFEEISQRIRRGDDADLDAYIAGHPKHADRIRAALPGWRAMIDLGHAISNSNDPASSQAAAKRPGTLGDFRILRELGRGGMGVVYEAEQISLDRRVALKVLPFAAMLDEKQLNRFKNEARAAATLNHPNIVSVHSVGCERSVHFYAMELIEGMSLAEAIGESRDKSPVSRDREPPVSRNAERGPRQQPPSDSPSSISHSPFDTDVAALSTQRSTNPKRYFDSIAQLGIQAARALHYAHQEGVIHRDIKPSNLMLDGDGNIHITDFGLARITSDASMTLTGDLVGTLRYMSAEQAGGDGIVDHRSDIYSLGITLYELATGTSAFPTTDRQKLLHQIADTEPTPPRQTNANIPRNLETIILKAIAKAPAVRYRSAQSLADDLERFRENLPITARRQGRIPRAVQWSCRNRALAVSLAISLLLLLILAVGGPIAALQQRELAQRADFARQRSDRLRYLADSRLAYEAWHRRDYREALRLLAPYQSPSNRVDRRGLEWEFLWNNLHLHNQIDGLLHEGTVQHFALSNDRRTLAVSCLDRRYYVWDLVTRELITSCAWPGDMPHTSSIAISNDRKTLVLGTWKGPVHVIDAHSGEILEKFDEHNESALKITLTADERYAIFGDSEGYLYQWNIRTGHLQRRLRAHQTKIKQIRILPDGNTVVSSATDGSICVSSCDLSVPSKVLHIPFSSETHIDLSRDGSLIYAGSAERSLWQVNLVSGDATALLRRRSAPIPIQSMALSEELNALAVRSQYNGIAILNASTGRPFHNVMTLPVMHIANTALEIAFAYDGSTLLFGDGNEIKLYELSILGNLPQCSPHVDAPHVRYRTLLEYVADVDKLIVCLAEAAHSTHVGHLRWWNLDEATSVERAHEYVAPAFDVAVSQQRGLVATAHAARSVDEQGSVSIYGARSHDLLMSLSDDHDGYRTVAFSPSGTMLAAGTTDTDNAIVVWNIESGAVAHRFRLPTDNARIRSVAFSVDGQQLIAGGGAYSRGEICVWNLETEQLDCHLNDVGSLVGRHIALSPDGRQMAFSTNDGSVQLWTIPELSRRMLITGNHFQVVFSPDGQRLATGVLDGNGLTLWDVKTGRQVAFLDTEYSVTDIAFVNRGRTVAAGLSSGDVVMFNQDGTITRLDGDPNTMGAPIDHMN